MTNSENKSISQQVQEYFEAVDESTEEKSDEDIEQDNQKMQTWPDEVEALRQKINNS